MKKKYKCRRNPYLKAEGVGLRVEGLGYGVGLRVEGLGFRDFRFRV